MDAVRCPRHYLRAGGWARTATETSQLTPYVLEHALEISEASGAGRAHLALILLMMTGLVSSWILPRHLSGGEF
jgi:hypothetical protein